MRLRDSNPKAYDASARRTLLDAYFEALERMRSEQETSDAKPETVAELGALWDRYVEGTPRPMLSRCPFSKEAVHHSIDPYGLDGLWWAFDSPARPIETLPPTFFALTGAVKLGSDREAIPLLCKPGPEVPFVVPRVLRHTAVRAVVTSLPIGAHTGFPIFYFANPIPWDLERVDTWGTGLYRFETLEGRNAWHSSGWEPEDFDFDLARWMRAGKLFWIDPDDPDGGLRGDPDGCPFLDVQGRRLPMNLQGTQVWDGVIFSEQELEDALAATARADVQAELGAQTTGKPADETGQSAASGTPGVPAEPEAPVVPEPAPEASPESEPPTQPGPKFCRECGQPLRPGAKFCGNCGTPVRRA
ncbi:MAG: zinc-ribbon domain-containing protein [Fimbriimonadaceae bacterium]|nr:zinc-ribbon domain-containing protein [Chthonomonadaceae bacterium]MCO5296837.1 zinc-ribbon domain-containing protein [Fimbriimonadaceae bacterium]